MAAAEPAEVPGARELQPVEVLVATEHPANNFTPKFCALAFGRQQTSASSVVCDRTANARQQMMTSLQQNGVGNVGRHLMHFATRAARGWITGRRTRTRRS